MTCELLPSSLDHCCPVEAGRAVSVVLSPVLTRLFTPAEFGNLSVFTSVLTLFATISSLGLELAIPICLADVECADLLAL